MRKRLAILGICILSGLGACQESAPQHVLPDSVSVTPPPASVSRLTQAQYLRSVENLLGDGLNLPVRLEPDARVAGFTAVGAARTTISSLGVELYEAAARDLARQVFLQPDRRRRVVGCEEETAQCRDAFLARTTRRAWRRSASDEELQRLRAVAELGTNTLGSFDAGLEYALSAILQSPNFLFRAELPAPGTDALDGYSLASRLSFFLWNAPPDDALLDAAESGVLLTEAGLEAEVDRLMADDRAREGVRQFFTQLYELDRLDGLAKAPELFPHISDDFGRSAREETLRVIEDLVFEERADFRDLLTTRKTFLNRKLAAVYDVRSPAREGFERFEFPESSLRRGIFGHASFLALWAHPVSTSATLRGMFVQQKLLCRAIPPPPAGVDTSIPEPSGTAPTLRDRIQEHLEDPTCAGCHRITDPAGLAFENFDGIGRFRATDDGAAVDTGGEFDGVAFEGPVELAELVRTYDEFGECLAQRLVNYAASHGEYVGSREEAETLGKVFAATGHDLLELIRLIVLSEGFRTVGGAE